MQQPSQDICPSSDGRAALSTVAVLASPSARDREHLRDTLAKHDIRVIEASSHREALDAIGRYAPAVVVYDESLPWRDVLSYGAYSCCPTRLIVVAATPPTSFVADVVNLGGYAVVSKPFSESQVHRSFWLEAYRSRAHHGHQSTGAEIDALEVSEATA